METTSSDPCVRTLTAVPRLRLALQWFKRALLGALHDPRRPQLGLVVKTLRERGVELPGRLSEGTLENWWLGTGNRANEQSCQALDAVAGRVLRLTRHCDGELIAPPPRFFSALMRGGLLRDMRDGLAQMPVGPLHLLMDAVDANRLDFDVGERPAMEAKKAIAEAVLMCLHVRWSPRWALAYRELSSPARSIWLAASPEERVALECRDEPSVAGHLERARTRGALPDWSRIPVGHDAQPNLILLTMVALAGDDSFWVEDRLSAWAWDLGIATLATTAQMWGDGKAQFSLAPVSNTMVVWYALMKAFYLSDDVPDACEFDEACECLGLSPTGPAPALLVRACQSYRDELASLGLRASNLGAVEWRKQRRGRRATC